MAGQRYRRAHLYNRLRYGGRTENNHRYTYCPEKLAGRLHHRAGMAETTRCIRLRGGQHPVLRHVLDNERNERNTEGRTGRVDTRASGDDEHYCCRRNTRGSIVVRGRTRRVGIPDREPQDRSRSGGEPYTDRDTHRAGAAVAGVQGYPAERDIGMDKSENRG